MHHQLATSTNTQSNNTIHRVISNVDASYRPYSSANKESASPHNSQMSTQQRNVLPTNVLPSNYRLTIEPNLKDFTFKGHVEIDVNINQDTDSIVLNGIELEVQSASLSMGGKTLQPKDTSYDEKNERITFSFDEKLSAKSKAVLTIDYTGIINDQLKGFYRSEYEKDGKKYPLGVTQFEAVDCRRAMPSWDEPEHKATFEFTMIVDDPTLTVLSNGAIISDKVENGRKIVSFKKTPPLCTYLYAWFVGHYDYIEAKTESGLPVRVYSPPGEVERGRFALEVAVKVVPWFEKFFNVPYMMDKLDHLAIGDFAAGAMENAGLLTFRSTALHVDPQASSLKTKQWVALVVAHEISHQWFGNYVSPSWWNYLWLNEGFATFGEYLVVDDLYPEWRIFDQFVELDVGSAFRLDALVSSHPVESTLFDAKDIDEIFDAISYSKGCALIRMMVNHVGIENFQKALRNYLPRFKYDNASSKDLWDAVSEASGDDITSLMDGWITKTGYPFIRVTGGEEKDGKRVFHLEQERFFRKGANKEDATVWKVPISYITDLDSKNPVRFLMDSKKGTITVPAGAKWIKLNPLQTGFYRVQYESGDFFKNLLSAVESKQISPIDRLGVLEDVCALAKAGYAQVGDMMQILSSFKNEDDYIVVKSLASNVDSLFTIAKKDSTLEASFKKFFQPLFENIFQGVGWDVKEGEDSLVTLKRVSLLGMLVNLKHPEIQAEASKRFEQYMKNRDSLSPDLRGLVYHSVISRPGDEGRKAFEELLKIYRTTDLNEERVRCLRTFGLVEHEDLLDSLLKKDFALKEVKSQDLFYLILGISHNKKGQELLWKWLVNNYDDISARIANGFLIGRTIKTCTESFEKEEEKAGCEKLFESKNMEGLKQTIRQIYESIDINIATVPKIRADLGQFFEK